MDSNEIKRALGITGAVEIKLGFIDPFHDIQDDGRSPEELSEQMDDWIESCTDSVMDDWDWEKLGKPTIEGLMAEIINNLSDCREDEFILQVVIKDFGGTIFNKPTKQLMREAIEREEKSHPWMEQAWKDYLLSYTWKEEDPEKLKRFNLYKELKNEFEGVKE
jgi:hypothetical protein